LNVFVADGVQPLVAQERDKVNTQQHFFRCNAARLLTIRSPVAIHESRRELFECGHLLADLWWAVSHHMSLAILAPPLRG